MKFYSVNVPKGTSFIITIYKWFQELLPVRHNGYNIHYFLLCVFLFSFCYPSSSLRFTNSSESHFRWDIMVTIFTIFCVFLCFFLLFSARKLFKTREASTYKVHYFLLCFFFIFFPYVFTFLKLGDYSVTVQVAKGRMTPQVFKLRRGEPI